MVKNDHDDVSVVTQSVGGVTQTTTTEDKTLEDGTRVIKKVHTLVQEHEHGDTTVEQTNTRRIETITEEERVVGQELTYWDCFLCCCPCFRVCFGHKRSKKEEEEGGDGGSKWKPVEPKE